MKVTVDPGGQVIEVSPWGTASVESKMLEPGSAARDFSIFQGRSIWLRAFRPRPDATELKRAAKVTVHPASYRVQVALRTPDLSETYVFEPTDAPQVFWIWPGWSVGVSERAEIAKFARAAA